LTLTVAPELLPPEVYDLPDHRGTSDDAVRVAAAGVRSSMPSSYAVGPRAFTTRHRHCMEASASEVATGAAQRPCDPSSSVCRVNLHLCLAGFGHLLFTEYE